MTSRVEILQKLQVFRCAHPALWAAG